MTTTEFERWTSTCVLLSKYAKPGQNYETVGRAIATLRRHAERIAKHAENECNREVTPAETRRAEAHEQAIRALCASHFEGVEPTFHGDPRGYAVKLRLRDGEHNTWGGAESGWGIA